MLAKSPAVKREALVGALERGGYEYKKQAHIGERLGTGKHFIDVLAEKDSKQFLISMKWQQSSGTTEQKVPFEVICLVEALENGNYEKAYLVLAGEGMKKKLKEFYLSGGLDQYLRTTEGVDIVTLEAFVAKANQGNL